MGSAREIDDDVLTGLVAGHAIDVDDEEGVSAQVSAICGEEDGVMGGEVSAVDGGSEVGVKMP